MNPVNKMSLSNMPGTEICLLSELARLKKRADTLTNKMAFTLLLLLSAYLPKLTTSRSGISNCQEIPGSGICYPD